MYKILILLLIISLIMGCSSQSTVTNRTDNFQVPEVDTKKLALDHFITGTSYEIKGDFSSAIIEFQDALNLDKSGGIYYALAKNYYYLNKTSHAINNAKKAVESDSSNKDYLILLSDIFSSAHQYDSSAVLLEKIIAMDSSDVNSHYKLARLYENDKPLQAIELYNRIVEQIGPDWNVMLRLAELNEKLGRLTEASAAIEELLLIDPANPSIKKLLIDYYQRDKKYDEALRIINDILELTPDDLEARERKAAIFIEKNDWENAAKEFSYFLEQPDVPLEVKVRIGATYFAKSLQDSSLLPITKEFFNRIDKDTSDWQVKIYLGAIALNERDDSTAIENFKYVTENARWNSEAWIRLGGLYFDNRRYEEASKVMYEAIESFPDDFVINLILGLSLAQREKHTEALPYLKKSVDLNPTDINALSAYAFTLNQLKDYDNATIYLNQALEIQPDDVNLLGTLGLIFDSQKNYAACDSVYERALQIDSSNALVNNNYAYSLSERGIELDKALNMAEIAIEQDSLNSSYLDTIGWVYFKLGDYSKAKYYIEKAIETGGESAVMLEHLGDIVYMMGQKDKAQDLWQKAFDLDASNNNLKTKINKGEI